MDTTTTTEELVRTVGDIPERMGAGVCFGSPIERDGRTLIPVARVSFGYGLGFGRGVGTGHGDHGQGEGAGEGGGLGRRLGSAVRALVPTDIPPGIEASSSHKGRSIEFLICSRSRHSLLCSPHAEPLPP